MEKDCMETDPSSIDLALIKKLIEEGNDDPAELGIAAEYLEGLIPENLTSFKNNILFEKGTLNMKEWIKKLCNGTLEYQLNGLEDFTGLNDALLRLGDLRRLWNGIIDANEDEDRQDWNLWFTCEIPKKISVKSAFEYINGQKEDKDTFEYRRRRERDKLELNVLAVDGANRQKAVVIESGTLEKSPEFKDKVEKLSGQGFQKNSPYPGTKSLDLMKILEHLNSEKIISLFQEINKRVFEQCPYHIEDGCDLVYDEKNNRPAPCDKVSHIDAINSVASGSQMALFENCDDVDESYFALLRKMYLGGKKEGFAQTIGPKYFNGRAQRILDDLIKENKEFEPTEEDITFLMTQENIDKFLKTIDFNSHETLIDHLKYNEMSRFEEVLLELLKESNPYIQKLKFDGPDSYKKSEILPMFE